MIKNGLLMNDHNIIPVNIFGFVLNFIYFLVFYYYTADSVRRLTKELFMNTCHLHDYTFLYYNISICVESIIFNGYKSNTIHRSVMGVYNN